MAKDRGERAARLAGPFHLPFMLTLQILDGGEPFFRPLERRSITLGSASSADVRLASVGVAPAHARIEPIEASDGLKIVDLGSEHGIRVNGESVVQWRLEPGDRIELGEAVLVVGQPVRRTGDREDVFERAVDSTRRPTTPRGSKKIVTSVIAVGVVVAALIAFGASHHDVPPPYLAEIDRLARAGEFEEARRLVGALRAEWAAGDEARNARADAILADVDALDAALVAGRTALVAAAGTATRAEQIKALRERQRADPNGLDGRVARLLLGELDELRLRAEPARPRVAEEPNEGPVAPPASEPARSHLVASIQAVAEAGDGKRALGLIDEAIATAHDADAAELRALRERIREELESEVGTIVGRARALAASGDLRDVEGAIALLEREGERFPATAGGNALGAELVRLRASLEAARPASSDPAASIAELVEAARAAEDLGDFATAAELVDALRERVADRDPMFARELTERRAELGYLLVLERHLAARVTAGDSLSLVTATGVPLSVEADGDRLRVAGRTHLPWHELLLPRLFAMLASGDAPESAVLGAVVLAQRAGAVEVAERKLLDLARPMRRLPPELAELVARGRGERLETARGYEVVDGVLVSVREIESRAAAERIARRLASALQRNAKARDAELDAILAEGPDALDAVVVALRKEVEARVAKLEKHSFKRTWDKLAERRVELDRRRRAALDLIYDEVRYFYPYKPPAVSGTKAAEYARVQAEIDELVREVAELWNDRASAKRPPAALLREVEKVDWLVDVLAGFGEPPGPALARADWVRTLPESGGLTLQNFALTPAEREAFDEWEHIERYNAAKTKVLSKAEVTQAEITNGYRRLLGRRPLAISPQLVEAARGHSEEMSRLGYFSHFSPVPGRKTPYERMKAAGYDFGISENIANHPSAESAHHGWTHSSGHHRNILSASHREFAVGNSGKYWTQNFGHGDGFRTDPDW